MTEPSSMNVLVPSKIAAVTAADFWLVLYSTEEADDSVVKGEWS